MYSPLGSWLLALRSGSFDWALAVTCNTRSLQGFTLHSCHLDAVIWLIYALMLDTGLPFRMGIPHGDPEGRRESGVKYSSVTSGT